jgi:hypothetical protein
MLPAVDSELFMLKLNESRLECRPCSPVRLIYPSYMILYGTEEMQYHT